MKRLNILMVSETVPARQLGGLAKHAVTLANALIAQGHQVTFMGLAGMDDDLSRQEMGFNGEFIGALECMAGWKEGALGCFNPIKRPFFAKRMASIIASHASAFDVVHYHGNLPLVAAYIPAHINFVQTRHDQGSECLIHLRFKDGDVCTALNPEACASCATPKPNALQQWVSTQAVIRYREVAAQALAQHKTVFVSEAIRRNAKRVLPEAAFARSFVVHNFLDQQRLENETSGIQPDTTSGWQIIIASRLDEAKGVGQFLAAWQHHQRPPLEAHITVVGDGPLRQVIEQQYSRPDITFLKHQAYAKTVRLTASSHVSVVPSLCEESCSTTTLEALSLGRPCFALRRGGTPELAAYQRWPGQLQLFDSMEDLVKGLIAHMQSHSPSSSVAIPHGDSSRASDVMALLPNILQVYEA